ncbi:hypothetical protein E4T52_15563 [Aureobasidium sp. EXF-3400]|nr:hypothetical protein E4T51_06038 [Aureobasidium sp. EXF-12344]KAI4769390.1 hypothetical protein E4T52_15563 [Aureobasidium sp. EXF-3400]
MPVRPATWADLKPGARIAALAFGEDEFLGAALHPHRAKHPKGFERFFLHDLYIDYFVARTRILVSFPNNQPDTITGMAVWSRLGDGGKHMETCNPGFTDSFIRPNRAADSAVWRDMEDSDPGVEEYSAKPEYKENWDLQLLFQSPQYQGRGFGKELVAEGLAWAKQEGVRVSVASAPGKEGFYKKLGIDEEVKETPKDSQKDPFPGSLLFSKKFDKVVTTRGELLLDTNNDDRLNHRNN